MNFKIDQRFKDHLRNLAQVFLYITDECNLRCQQCLYKPDLIFHLKEKEIPLKTALSLVSDFREMGASKLTIMGGEPTLYGISREWRPLLKIIKEAKDLGYEYIRIDTNGQFESKLLIKGDFKKLDEITFSIDGPTPEINDPIRGKGTFTRCVSNIKTAIKLNYRVDITCCLHKGLLKKDKDGKLLLGSMIHFAEKLGVSRINFHDLFKTEIPRDTWTGNLNFSTEEWLRVYKEIEFNIKTGEYKIPVRVPQCFVTQDEFGGNPEYYGYCPAKMGERVLIHPNGIIRVCSLLICTPYGIAKFYENKIIWDDGPTNELRDHKFDQNTPCTNQNKSKKFGNLVPLCVSFKPKQEEFVWKKKLEWEKKREK